MSEIQSLNETLIGQAVVLKRAKLNKDMAEDIFRVVDKCRDVFLPWLGWVASTVSVDDTWAFLEKSDKEWTDKEGFVYAVYHQEKFIGLISVLNVAWKHDRAEIGYWLDTDYTGRGFVSQAISLIEKELFGKGFNRLVIHTDVMNEKSANVARRKGYTHEGILRQEIFSIAHQRYRDMNVFSKLRADYQKDT